MTVTITADQLAEALDEVLFQLVPGAYVYDQKTPPRQRLLGALKSHTGTAHNMAARFFLPVAQKFGKPETGDHLVYTDSSGGSYRIKGDGLQYGIKWYNEADKRWQGVRGDGAGVIIVGGELTGDKAKQLQAHLVEVTDGTGDPEKLSHRAIHSWIACAKQMGLTDIWTGKVDDVLKARRVDGRPVTAESSLKDLTGHFVHAPNPAKGVAAVYVSGGAEFHGHVAGGRQNYAGDEGFYVTIGQNKDGSVQFRGIAKAAFERDYVNVDGKPLTPADFYTVDAVTRMVAVPETVKRMKQQRRTWTGTRAVEEPALT